MKLVLAAYVFFAWGLCRAVLARDLRRADPLSHQARVLGRAVLMATVWPLTLARLRADPAVAR